MIFVLIFGSDLMFFSTLHNKLNGCLFGDYEVSMQNYEIDQPAAGHRRHQNSQYTTNQYNIRFVILIMQRKAIRAEGDTSGQQNEGRYDQTIKLEVVLGSHTIVKPSTVVIHELYTPSAS